MRNAIFGKSTRIFAASSSPSCSVSSTSPSARKFIRGGIQKPGVEAIIHRLANLAKGFVEDTATKTGIAERTIRREVRRAEKIEPDIRDAIRGTPIAESGVELDALASMSPKD